MHQLIRVLYIAVFVFLLCAPLIFTTFVGRNEINLENRVLAEFPDINDTTWFDFPENFESFVNDRLYFRSFLNEQYAWSMVNLFEVSPFPDKLTVGKNGYLFLTAEDALKQYNGKSILLPWELGQVVENNRARLAYCKRKNIKFLLVMAPSKHSIYSEYLPDHNQKRGDSTTTSQIDRVLTQYGIHWINLTPLLLTKKGEQLYFKNDTHWNALGCFYACSFLLEKLNRPFNDTCSAIAKQLKVGGDLANMAGLPKRKETTWLMTNEWKPKFRNVEVKGKTVTLHSFCNELLKDSSKLVVFHDSFGEEMKNFLPTGFSENHFIRTEIFDTLLLDSIHPDVVIFEFVERYHWRLRTGL